MEFQKQPFWTRKEPETFPLQDELSMEMLQDELGITQSLEKLEKNMAI